MKNSRSLKTTPQLKVKLKWQYKVAAAIALAAVVGIGFFVFLNFGNNRATHAETAAADAGITSYDFAWGTNGTLANMSSGTTTLIGSNKDEVGSEIMSLGFNFVFMGKSYDSFSVNANGVLRFGDDPIVPDANTYGIPGNDRVVVFAVAGASYWGIFPSDARLKTSANGKVHYKVLGTYPNRHAVIEWSNMELPAGSNSKQNTFQLKLYESEFGSGPSGGTIEMVYGDIEVGRNYLIDYRIGFGIGPESGNFYAINTSNGNISDVTNYTNENSSGRLTPFNRNRRYARFQSDRRPEGSFADFELICPSQSSASVKFKENSENEAGIAVYRKKIGENDDKFKFLRSLSPDSRVLSDGGITVGQRYVYRFYFLGESQYSTDYTDYVTDPIPTSSAYQTVLSGNWTTPATWGGTLPGDYKDVVIGCSGTVFITANAHAKVKNLTIEAGSFFTIPDGQTVEVAGDFINNGVFNPVGTGKLLFTGGEDQIIENNGSGKTNDTKFTSNSPDRPWAANATGKVAEKTVGVNEAGFIAIKEVLVDIEHTYLRDLTLYLVAPDGTRFKLAENRGQRGENYTNVSFTPLGQPLPPSIQNVNLTGSYRPEESFSSYAGPLNGVWTLSVNDLMTGVGGTLRKFELTLTKGGSNDLVLKDIIVKKSGGSLTLNSGLFIEGNLNLQSGIIYTSNDNLITFESGSTSSPGNLDSFISGPVLKKGNQNFVFPIGRADKWAPLAIADVRNANSTTTFRAEYFSGAKDGDNTLEESDLQIVSDKEYWDLSPIVGTPSVDITFHWKNNSGEFINPNTVDNLVVAHYTGGKWINEIGIVNPNSEAGIGGQGSISVDNINSFSPFTFGSTSIEGILPVELVSFTGVNKGKENLLTWVTASENNNSHFEVEKSLDGKIFEEIGRVQGNGDAHQEITYTYTDRLLTSPQAYYRLKQVDFNGEYEYSKIVLISGASMKPEIKLYPNPANEADQFVTIDITGLNVKQADLIIRNANGQTVFQALLDEDFGLAKEQINISSLKTGIYIVEINTIHGKEVKRLIVR